MTKKMINDLVDEFHITGHTLSSISNMIDALILQYGEFATMEETNRGYGYGHFLGVYAMREETDDEYLERIEKEKVIATAKQSRDLAEYERLSKLYGDSK